MPAHLRHITDVGRNKAIGLLSTPEVRALGAHPSKLRRDFTFRARAHTYLFIEMKEGDIFWDNPLKAGEGNVAVACLPQLQKLIDAKKDAIEAMGWPTDAEAFFKKSLETSAISSARSTSSTRSAVMSVIIDAYNHPYTQDKWTRKRLNLF